MLAILAAEEAAPNPILPVGPEIFWAIIGFFGLWALMKYVLLPPVERGMAERAEALRNDLDAAEEAKLQAASAAGGVADQLAPARSEAAAIIDAAREEAEAERATILAAANAEVDAMKDLMASNIATERAAAMAGIGPKVAELASSAASKVIERPVNSSTAQPVVDRLLNNN